MSAGARKLSILVLSFNGRAHLETCLPAVAAQRDPGCDWELLLLDNGSRDGTADWVRAHHPWVRLVE
ncbi:MAG: glycosyltransferase, partial [Thermoanaerobaculia bacterium]